MLVRHALLHSRVVDPCDAPLKNRGVHNVISMADYFRGLRCVEPQNAKCFLAFGPSSDFAGRGSAFGLVKTERDRADTDGDFAVDG